MASNARPDVFIIGAPRSGTTWLQRMLGQHPAIATPRETHFIHEFLAPAEGAWKRQRTEAERNAVELAGVSDAALARMGGTFGGMPSLFDEHEFYEILRSMYRAVRDRSLSLKPSATVFLEKTPSNSLHVELLNQLAPESQFIHLVRHPYEVVASLLAARQGWGRAWAPSSADAAARTYRRHVEAALVAQRFGARYREVRYEDLRQDAPRTLRWLLLSLGLDVGHDHCLGTVSAPAKGERTARTTSPYVGAYVSPALGAGTSTSTSTGIAGVESLARAPVALDSYQRWCVEREAGALMARFGYPATAEPSRSPLYESRRVVSRLARGLKYEGGQLLSRAKEERTSH